MSPPMTGPKPKPNASINEVVAAARCKSPLRLKRDKPIEAEVTIKLEAIPISTRLKLNEPKLHAIAETPTPAVTRQMLNRSTGMKPYLSLSLHKNSRPHRADAMYTTETSGTQPT